MTRLKTVKSEVKKGKSQVTIDTTNWDYGDFVLTCFYSQTDKYCSSKSNVATLHLTPKTKIDTSVNITNDYDMTPFDNIDVQVTSVDKRIVQGIVTLTNLESFNETELNFTNMLDFTENTDILMSVFSTDKQKKATGKVTLRIEEI